MKKGKLLMALLALALFVSSCEMTPEKIQPFDNSIILKTDGGLEGDPPPPPPPPPAN